MGGVLRVVQVVQRKVGRDDQRLAAAVTAVNHIEHLFQPVQQVPSWNVKNGKYKFNVFTAFFIFLCKYL